MKCLHLMAAYTSRDNVSSDDVREEVSEFQINENIIELKRPLI